MDNIEVFCIITALVIVVTRLILSYMEEKDRSKGLPINPEEYKIGGLLKLIFKDLVLGVKNLFRGSKKSGKK